MLPSNSNNRVVYLLHSLYMHSDKPFCRSIPEILYSIPNAWISSNRYIQYFFFDVQWISLYVCVLMHFIWVSGWYIYLLHIAYCSLVAPLIDSNEHYNSKDVAQITNIYFFWRRGLVFWDIGTKVSWKPIAKISNSLLFFPVLRREFWTLLNNGEAV